jgi:hypothetical protein
VHLFGEKDRRDRGHWDELFVGEVIGGGAIIQSVARSYVLEEIKKRKETMKKKKEGFGRKSGDTVFQSKKSWQNFLTI